MKIIFPGKSYTKFVGQTSPSLFNKKSKWSISLDQQSEMLWILFLQYVYAEVYQNMLQLSCWVLGCRGLGWRGLELVYLPYFSA